MSKELSKYIRECRKEGFKDKDVRDVLIKQGHDEAEIDKAFSEIADEKASCINCGSVAKGILAIVAFLVLNLIVIGGLTLSSSFFDPSLKIYSYGAILTASIGLGFLCKFALEKTRLTNKFILRSGFFIAAITSSVIALAVFVAAIFQKRLLDAATSGIAGIGGLSSVFGPLVNAPLAGILIYICFSLPFLLLIKEEEKKLMPILSYIGFFILYLGIYFTVGYVLEAQLLASVV